MQNREQQYGFRPDIEGLRGIAVLAVVAFHCRIPGFSGGFAGVDIFFVLSGYLITGLLIAEFEKNTRIRLLQFYSRRIRRLLPASALTLIVTMLLGAFILGPGELSFAGRAARGTAIYLSNIFFGINAADYFNTSVENNPMLHTWSLAVEEQFYLCWPLLIMAGLQGLRSRKALVTILTSLTLISLCVSIWATPRGGTFAFYQLPARAWEFGIGGLAALFVSRRLRPAPRIWVGAGWAGVLVIAISSCCLSPGAGNFPGWIALIPVLGTVVALLAGAEAPGKGVGILLALPPLQFLGKTSYSWYLWHWPFLVMALALWPKISISGKLVVAVLALLVAAITHRFIENPIRFHPFLIKQPWRTLAMGAALTCLSLGTATAFTKLANHRASKPEMKPINLAGRDFGRLPDDCMTGWKSPGVKRCDYGDPDLPQIVLFGDSHSIQWFNPLETIARERGWKLTVVWRPNCPAVDIRPRLLNEATADSCVEWRSEAFLLIERMNPAIIVMASAVKYIENERHQDYEKGVSLQEWQRGTERTLRRLSARSQVILLRDTPVPWTNIPSCLERSIQPSWLPASSCDMSRAESLNPAVFEAEKAAAHSLKNVHVIDMSDQFCDDRVCRPPEMERSYIEMKVI
jgi:peptidoglycan/LPS O-acetylase OafA/YrhL